MHELIISFDHKICNPALSTMTEWERLLMPTGHVSVLFYASVLWLLGFAWGMVVFISPALRSIASVAYVSKLPAVSVVLIPVYSAILYFLTRASLKGTTNGAIAGLKFGLWLAIPNIILDAIVYVILFASYDYFSYVSIWVAYALFLIIPVVVGARVD